MSTSTGDTSCECWNDSQLWFTSSVNVNFQLWKMNSDYEHCAVVLSIFAILTWTVQRFSTSCFCLAFLHCVFLEFEIQMRSFPLNPSRLPCYVFFLCMLTYKQQKIKIQMQISWVGWSTISIHESDMNCCAIFYCDTAFKCVLSILTLLCHFPLWHCFQMFPTMNLECAQISTRRQSGVNCLCHFPPALVVSTFHTCLTSWLGPASGSI